MERLSVSVVYFSPTRTSAAIARAIAAGMGNVAVKEYDITCDAPESIRLDSDIAIMAVPVYGGRVAETAVERLKHVSTSVALAVPVVVYGALFHWLQLLLLVNTLTAVRKCRLQKDARMPKIWRKPVTLVQQSWQNLPG